MEMSIGLDDSQFLSRQFISNLSEKVSNVEAIELSTFDELFSPKSPYPAVSDSYNRNTSFSSSIAEPVLSSALSSPSTKPRYSTISSPTMATDNGEYQPIEIGFREYSADTKTFSPLPAIYMGNFNTEDLVSIISQSSEL